MGILFWTIIIVTLIVSISILARINISLKNQEEILRLLKDNNYEDDK